MLIFSLFDPKAELQIVKNLSTSSSSAVVPHMRHATSAMFNTLLKREQSNEPFSPDQPSMNQSTQSTLRKKKKLTHIEIREMYFQPKSKPTFVSRYKTDFEELAVVGQGASGQVVKSK